MKWARANGSLLFLLAVVVGLAGANLLLTARAVNRSQHQWCATLTLLTAHTVPRPADPAANPSRENAYIFYANLLTLRQRFGCG